MNPLVELLQKLPVIVLLLICAFWVAMGDYFAKSWSVNQKNSLYILAFLSYALVGIFYLSTLLKEGLAVTTVIYSLLSILISLFIGIIMFGETMSFVRLLGLILGLISLVILIVAK